MLALGDTDDPAAQGVDVHMAGGVDVLELEGSTVVGDLTELWVDRRPPTLAGGNLVGKELCDAVPQAVVGEELTFAGWSLAEVQREVG